MGNLLTDITRRRKEYEKHFFVHTCVLHRKVKVTGVTRQGLLRRQRVGELKGCFANRPSRELRDFNPEHVLQTGGYYFEFSVGLTLTDEDIIEWNGKFYSVRNLLDDDVAALAKIALLDVIPTNEIPSV